MWDKDGYRPWTWAPGLDILPVRHGSAVFSLAVRQALWAKPYQAIGIGFPAGWDEELGMGLDALPEVGALVFRESRWGQSPTCYLPFDPCDAYVEAWRQARLRKLPLRFLEDATRFAHPRRVSLPDPQLLPALGPEGYHRFALRGMGEGHAEAWEAVGRIIVQRLRELRARFENVLVLLDYPVLPWVEKAFANPRGGSAPSENETPWTADFHFVKPAQLYFGLGEAPFFSAEVEKERQNPFSSPRPYFETIKALFLRTREQFLDMAVEKRAVTVKGIQQALNFTRNLAALEGGLSPSLFDLVTAAKGVLGSRYAARLLDAARYYPYFTPEREAWLEIGPEKIKAPEEEAAEAFNLLADAPKAWKAVRLKREPDQRKQREYRYAWDHRGLCSHLPEDARIEKFNRVVRARAQDMDLQTHARVERLTSSLKDGIDMRETLRQWHTRGIFVKEAPPRTRKVDTVIILFDQGHDERYPQRVTWYAEHRQESTLTFYATDPMDKMLGPGIAEGEYGGLSLLFPPRPIPDIFSVSAESLGLKSLAEQLVYGALCFSREKCLAYVAEKPPNLRMIGLARRFNRKLIPIPLTHFSAETLGRLRRFHMLNGKQVRTWASRFIQE